MSQAHPTLRRSIRQLVRIQVTSYLQSVFITSEYGFGTLRGKAIISLSPTELPSNKMYLLKGVSIVKDSVSCEIVNCKFVN